MSGRAGRRVVVITGAGGALGSAISHRLACEPDTDLVLSDVSERSLDDDGLRPPRRCTRWPPPWPT